jgi:hypothetical protein
MEGWKAISVGVVLLGYKEGEFVIKWKEEKGEDGDIIQFL